MGSHGQVMGSPEGLESYREYLDKAFGPVADLRKYANDSVGLGRPCIKCERTEPHDRCTRHSIGRRQERHYLAAEGPCLACGAVGPLWPNAKGRPVAYCERDADRG